MVTQPLDSPNEVQSGGVCQSVDVECRSNLLKMTTVAFEYREVTSRGIEKWD